MIEGAFNGPFEHRESNEGLLPMRVLTLRQLIMIDLNGRDMVSAMAFLSGRIADWRLKIQLLSKGVIAPFEESLASRAQTLQCFIVLEQTSRQLDMRASNAAARRATAEGEDLISYPRFDSHTLAELVSLLERLVQVFNDELEGQRFLTVPNRHARFLQDEAAFGVSVEDAFPSASYDIAEAAKCRALARWTASVMHLMRVVEAGLAALAKHYGVAADNNWNQTLNQIEAKTREVGRKTHGADAEQWAAEAATHLRFVKNAWRNQAMHPRQIYDEERAVAIFDSTRAFMQHLSSHLSEFDIFD